MRKLKTLLLLMCIMCSYTLFAQKPAHKQYVKIEPAGTKWYTAYRNWNPGTELYTTSGSDDEFFISRVKPKTRFTNANTQVKTTMNPERKLLWWCPIGTAGWNAIPSFHFDSEVFSMWSYVDIYGNWTAPFIRMPGAFADICHKNGVKTSTLASVPWYQDITSSDGGHGSNMKAMIDGGADKLLKYLRYYGIDGIGYNSEFNIKDGLSANSLKNFLSESFKKKDAANWPTFTNAWYSLMTNAGNVGGTDYLSSSNIDWFQYNGNPTSDAYFMNYNWGASALGVSQQSAESKGRSSFDVYAGMNFQGRGYADWMALQNYNISIGIWGAHDMNMIFEGRGELGANKIQKQRAYQLISENVFTGSSYNPVNTPPVSNLLAHTSLQKKFHGFSSFITARSVLTTDDLAKEPFVSYFNLGNGLFFNVEGKKEFPNQWYNIGIQDYLPTWRWWWTNNFMGRETSNVPSNGMKAQFTWDDAWFAGSSLEISGQTSAEYLHLFKTQYPLQEGDKLLIRYKVISGTGAIRWACAALGAEQTEVGASIASDLTADDEVWLEKVVTVGPGRTQLRMQDQTMALMGLKFQDTSADFKILIGEISLTRGTTDTPSVPTLTQSEVLGANYLGVDLKVIFKMRDRSASSPEIPIYNSDVDTWYFKIYTQQEGEESVMSTATTSWAAYVVSAPLNLEGTKKMRVGVSAVSIDGKSESEIIWSDYMTIPALNIVEGIEIDKNVIKANEEFTIKYKDPNHPAAKWEILNAQTGEAAVPAVSDTKSITTSLPETGIYDLKMTSNGVEKIHQGLIQISVDEVGALPQIHTLKANDSQVPITVDADKPVTFTYTGRPADGKVSRGLLLPEKAFAVPAEQLNFTSTTPFTIAFWFNPLRFNHLDAGTQLLNVRTAQDKWPASDWGYIWSTIGKNNKYSISFRRQDNSGTQIDVDDFVFGTNQWYHFALVVDYVGGRQMTLYINGRKIKTSQVITNLYQWKNSNVIMVGGQAAFRAGLDGYIDEFQLYQKALNENEVKASMDHQTVIPEGLIGYWDFETDADENGKLKSTGTNKNLIAYTADSKTMGEGNNEYPPTESTFAPGAPFIAGSNYLITTTPSWKSGKGSSVKDVLGNGEAGSSNITFSKEGTYTATLTLSNGWGSDTKTFEYVTVKAGSSIDATEMNAAYNAYPNPFYNEVNVRFEEAGKYMVEILNTTGTTIDMHTVEVNAGGFVTMNVSGNPGIYLIHIKRDGKTLRALKVIKK